MKWLVENAVNVQALVELLLTFATISSIFFMLWLRRTTPSRSEVGNIIDAAVDPVSDRAAEAKRVADGAAEGLANLTRKVDGLARKEDVANILEALAKQDGDRRALSERVDAVRDILTRIETPLDMLMQEALRK